MDEVEKANMTAVESCHRVISILSQPQDQPLFTRSLSDQTGEAVHKFKRLTSLLDSTIGHARVRKSKKSQTPFPQNIFLENLVNPRLPLNFLQLNQEPSNPISQNGLSMKTHSLELTPHPRIPQQQLAPLSNYHFIQQQRAQIQQQQIKNQAELMYRRSNSGINLNFDSSTCTPTMSSTRSFISSLSVDGSVANRDGNAFHLIGSARSADQGPFSSHKRRCSSRGADGSVECGGSGGRCHCAKKRKHRVKMSIKVPGISNKLAALILDLLIVSYFSVSVLVPSQETN